MQTYTFIEQAPPRKVRAIPHVARDWQCDVVLHLVVRSYGVPLRLLLHPSRCRATTARARQLAMYLAHVVLGRNMADVGKWFGRDRTTVAYACARIEDLRDDDDFEAEVLGLERQIEAVIIGFGEAVGHGAH